MTTNPCYRMIPKSNFILGGAKVKPGTTVNGGLSQPLDPLPRRKMRNVPKGLTCDVSSLIFEGRLKFAETKLLNLGNRYDNDSDFVGQNSPRVSLNHLPNEASSMKACYGEAFRAAIVAEIFGNSTLLGNASLSQSERDDSDDYYENKLNFWLPNLFRPFRA